MNQLFFGDNLHVLRDQLAAESVGLIYPDPPFNSKRVRFKLSVAGNDCKFLAINIRDGKELK